MLNSWTVQNIIISEEWKGLVIAILEAGLQFHDKHGGRRNLGLQNIEIGQEALIFPRLYC